MLKVRTFWKDAVLEGRKTRSYRPWKRPFKVGSVHECRPSRSGPVLAWVEITRVWEQYLGDITEEDAHHNGYPTLKEMLEHFCLTYADQRARGKSKAWWKQTLATLLDHSDRGPMVWGMEFKVVGPPAARKGRR